MSTAIRWLVGAVIVLGALLLAIGGSTIAPPLSSQVAGYLTDRNLALAVLLVALLIVGRARTLALIVLVAGVMHAADAAFDVRFGNVPAAVGSVVFAVLFLAAAAWLRGQPATERLFGGRRASGAQEVG